MLLVTALSAAAALAQWAPPAPPPTRAVLFDTLLVACHRADVGWFTGPACEAAAAGQPVVDHRGKARTLPTAAREAPCGGVEGYRAFGPDDMGGGHLWFSRGVSPVACPAEKAPAISKAERAAIIQAVKADVGARPSAWATWEPARDGKPITDTFEIIGAVKQGARRYVAVRGFGRDLRALVRLGGGPLRIIERNPHGPVGLLPDRCVDVDGDGRAEVWVSSGGETERSYRLVRFVDDRPSTAGALHCGD